jgi:hypothetical protein
MGMEDDEYTIIRSRTGLKKRRRKKGTNEDNLQLEQRMKIHAGIFSD